MSTPETTPPAELAATAADPSTPLATLAEIAGAWPTLRAAIAANPSTYDDLLAWLGNLGDPAVDAALAARAAAAASPPPPPPPAVAVAAPAVAAPAAAAAVPAPAETVKLAEPAADAPASALPGSTFVWSEPTRAVPLRWGTYELRYASGLFLVVLAFINPFVLTPIDYRVSELVIPLLVGAAGFVALPSTIGRRIGGFAIAAPSLLVASGGVGVVGALLLVLPLLAWLLVRKRSGLSYLTLIPFAVGFILTSARILWISLPAKTPYVLEFVVLHVQWMIFLALWAWVALAISRLRAPAIAARPPAPDRAELAHAARVQAISSWEAAYREAHDGEAPPPGFMPPAAFAATGSSTNLMAILALVFGIGGGLLGIVFGHVARGQIRRTGEGGWGLATAGLVLGYVGLGVGVIAAIAYAILLFA
jgi:hypothetical protein